MADPTLALLMCPTLPRGLDAPPRDGHGAA